MNIFKLKNLRETKKITVQIILWTDDKEIKTTRLRKEKRYIKTDKFINIWKVTTSE